MKPGPQTNSGHIASQSGDVPATHHCAPWCPGFSVARTDPRNSMFSLPLLLTANRRDVPPALPLPITSSHYKVWGGSLPLGKGPHPAFKGGGCGRSMGLGSVVGRKQSCLMRLFSGDFLKRRGENDRCAYNPTRDSATRLTGSFEIPLPKQYLWQRTQDMQICRDKRKPNKRQSEFPPLSPRH